MKRVLSTRVGGWNPPRQFLLLLEFSTGHYFCSIPTCQRVTSHCGLPIFNAHPILEQCSQAISANWKHFIVPPLSSYFKVTLELTNYIAFLWLLIFFACQRVTYFHLEVFVLFCLVCWGVVRKKKSHICERLEFFSESFPWRGILTQQSRL